VVAGPPSLRPAEDKVRKTKPIARSGAPRRCPAAEIPQRSTVLSFHHPLPQPGGTKPAGWGTSGPIVRNKPNSHPRAGVGGASPTLLRQTNPISRRGRVGRGPRVAGRGGQLRQTNPIWPPDRQARPWPEQIVRNKANCPLEGVGRGRPTHEARGHCAKQTQCGPGLGRAKSPVGERCETNPICRRTGGRGHGWSQSC
jgi:hypothetical protein